MLASNKMCSLFLSRYLILPFFPHFQLELFGYNCLQGNCNIIKYYGLEYKIWEIIDGCFMWVPCGIMVLSYGFIWCYILSNDKELKRVVHNDVRKVITKRERQTAMTFFSVFLCYFVCVIPSTPIIYLIHGSNDDYPFLNFVTGCLFYLQFSINIFIYAAKSEQYKKAYIYFLKKVSKYVLTFNHLQKKFIINLLTGMELVLFG